MLQLCRIGDQTTLSSLLSSVKLKFAENLWEYNLVFSIRAFYTASEDDDWGKVWNQRYDLNLSGCALPWTMFEKPTISYQNISYQLARDSSCSCWPVSLLLMEPFSTHHKQLGTPKVEPLHMNIDFSEFFAWIQGSDWLSSTHVKDFVTSAGSANAIQWVPSFQSSPLVDQSVWHFYHSEAWAHAQVLSSLGPYSVIRTFSKYYQPCKETVQTKC